VPRHGPLDGYAKHDVAGEQRHVVHPERLGRCSLATVAEESAQRSIDVQQLAAELKERVEQERAGGAYADDLSGVELQSLPLAEDASSPRVRFRPELGFSSKPVIGPVITFVKRLILRLQFYVLDDLARQADAAIANVEARLAAEIATRERLEDEMEAKTRELEDKIRLLEGRSQR
jgi:hypothetical protein